MKRVISSAVFASIMLTSECGLRYAVIKPPQPEKKIVAIPVQFKKEKPITEQIQIPLPKALAKKKEAQLYNH